MTRFLQRRALLVCSIALFGIGIGCTDDRSGTDDFVLTVDSIEETWSSAFYTCNDRSVAEGATLQLALSVEGEGLVGWLTPEGERAVRYVATATDGSVHLVPDGFGAAEIRRTAVPGCLQIHSIGELVLEVAIDEEGVHVIGPVRYKASESHYTTNSDAVGGTELAITASVRADDLAPSIAIRQLERSLAYDPASAAPTGGVDLALLPWEPLLLRTSEPVAATQIAASVASLGDFTAEVDGTEVTLQPVGWWAPGAENVLDVPALVDRAGNVGGESSLTFVSSGGVSKQTTIDFEGASVVVLSGDVAIVTESCPSGSGCARLGSGRLFARLDATEASTIALDVQVEEVATSFSITVVTEGESPTDSASTTVTVEPTSADAAVITVPIPTGATTVGLAIERRIDPTPLYSGGTVPPRVGVVLIDDIAAR